MMTNFWLMSQVGTIALILVIVLVIAAVVYLALQEKKRKERSRQRAEERRKRREEALAKMRQEEESGEAFKRALEEQKAQKEVDSRDKAKKNDLDTLRNVRVEDGDTNVFQTGKYRFSTGKVGRLPEEETKEATAAAEPAPMPEPAPVYEAPIPEPTPVYEAPVAAPEPIPVPEPVEEAAQEPEPIPEPEPVPELIPEPEPAPIPEPMTAGTEEVEKLQKRFDFKKWASQLDEEVEVEKQVYVEPEPAEAAELAAPEADAEEAPASSDELTFEIESDDDVMQPIIPEAEAYPLPELEPQTAAIKTIPQTAPVQSAPVQRVPEPIVPEQPVQVQNVTPEPEPVQPAPTAAEQVLTDAPLNQTAGYGILVEEEAEEVVEEISAAPVPPVRPQEPVRPQPTYQAQPARQRAPQVTERAYQMLETVEADHSAAEEEFDDITKVTPYIREQLDQKTTPDMVQIPPVKEPQVQLYPEQPQIQITQPKPQPRPTAAPQPAPARQVPVPEEEDYYDDDYDDEEPAFDPNDPETIRLQKLALRRAEREARMKEKERYAAQLAGIDDPETGYDEDDEDYYDDDYDEDDELPEEKGGALRVILWIIAAILSLFCVGAILYLMFGNFLTGGFSFGSTDSLLIQQARAEAAELLKLPML